MNIDRKVRLRADSLHRFEKRRSCLRESATKRIIAAADGYSENRQIGHVCAGGYDADYANLHIGMYAHARMGTVLCSPLRRRSGRVSGAWPARAPAVVFFVGAVAFVVPLGYLFLWIGDMLAQSIPQESPWMPWVAIATGLVLVGTYGQLLANVPIVFLVFLGAIGFLIWRKRADVLLRAYASLLLIGLGYVS